MVHKEGIVYFLKSPDNKYYVGTTRQTMQKTLVQLKSYAKKKEKTCQKKSKWPIWGAVLRYVRTH